MLQMLDIIYKWTSLTEQTSTLWNKSPPPQPRKKILLLEKHDN